MASRGGVRAAGSDGGDFNHREKVASHYQASSTFKTRMKIAIFIHFVLFFFMFAKLLLETMELFGLQVEEKYGFQLPKALVWEWIWSVGIVFAAISCLGIKKNRVSLMKAAGWGIFIFGVLPVICGAVSYFEDLLAFAFPKSNRTIDKFKGIPIVAVWYFFIAIAFQVHMLSIVFALKLINAWSVRKSKKTS